MIAMYMAMFFSSPAVAGMVGSLYSGQIKDAELRVQEVNKIQRALENEVVKEKLQAYGLQADEVKTKLQGMTDEQIHMLAQASDKVLAGGDDGLGLVIAILVIILLVVLVVKLMDKTIVVK